MVASLPPSSAASTAATAYIGGGGLAERLQHAQTQPATLRLPGGHHYMATDFAFVPAEQQSIKGKVDKVAALLFGGYDPACMNLAREQGKSREQQIADGYTRGDLQRIAQEHHCG